MKRRLLVIIAFTSISYCVSAQLEVVRFQLEHNKAQSKKITISSKNDSFTSVELTLECKWDSITDHIQFFFNRSLDFSESGAILCFSMYNGRNMTSIKRMRKSNSTVKALWLAPQTRHLSQLQYFLRSDDGKSDEASHYITLPNGIMETFNFYMNNGKASAVSLDFRTYFLKQEKKRCGRRNMKIIGEAYDVNVKIELLRPVKDPCKGSDVLLNELIDKIAQLEGIQEKDIAQIKKGPNCAAKLKEKQTAVGQSFLERYPEWDNFFKCEMIEEAIIRYSEVRTAILSDTCAVVARRVVATSCSVDFKTVNNNLMNLQIDILRKKRNGERIEAERTNYLAIKNDVDKRITPNCPKDQVESYRTFCRNIEKALNE